jgi:hypothetical protein
MTIQAARLTILMAAGLTGLAGLLAGCATSTGLGDGAPAAKPPAVGAASPDITGSIVTPPPAQAAEQSAPSQQATPLQSAILPLLFLSAGQ